MEQYLGVPTLAKKYDISVKTIRRALTVAKQQGFKIKKIKIFGATRYCEEDVEAFMEKLSEQQDFKIQNSK